MAKAVKKMEKNNGTPETDKESSVNNILKQTSLKWIFLGGKGGVGKTTCACALAVLLSKVRESVLIISTDPAHNISDTFDQKFTKAATLVNGFTNLYAMEIDWNAGAPDQFFNDSSCNTGQSSSTFMYKQILADVFESFPGMENVMNYAELMTAIKNMSYSVVVFDSAPSGPTLKFLSYPQALQKTLTNISQLIQSIGSSPFVFDVVNLMGMQELIVGDFLPRIEELIAACKAIDFQFKNAQLTTFVCVCMAEFLSLFDTEKTVQALLKQKVDVRNIVVNEVLVKKPNETPCTMCEARMRIQAKYLDQIRELYEDFHVTQLPFMDKEIRGVENVSEFAELMTKPHQK